MFAYHDYRPTVTFSVCSQAQERPNHYESKYPDGFQRILIFGSVKTFQLSAGMITYKQFLEKDYKKQKVDRRRSGDQVVYQIKNSVDNLLHPEYNGMYSETRADEILFILGSFVAPQLSARVKGTVKECHEISCEFLPCSSETFPSLGLTIKNPFINSNEEMARDPEKYPVENGQIGNLRYWNVYDYSYVKHNKNAGYGKDDTSVRATICYKDGVLGIALRRPTGVITTESSLTSHKSMYHSRDSNA